MLITRRTVRTSQPQGPVGINWSNPITKGLVAVYDAGSGDMTRNLVASASPLTNNGAVVGLSDKGKVLTLNGGGYLRNSTIAPVAAAPITFLCFTRPRVDLASAGDKTIFLLSIDNGYSYIYKLYSASAGNGLIAQTYDGGNSAAIIGGSYQQAGKWYFAGARWASNSSRSVFQDELSVSDTGTRSAPSGINSISIGYSPWSSGETWDGDIAIPMLWNRALSDSEIKSIRENPWQIFEDEEDYLFIPAAGGGSSVSLVVSEALHGHVADSPTFSMDTYLAVAESLHSHAADNLTISATGAASLVVQDAAHGHVADGVALTTQWLFSVADAFHGHAADNVALSTRWLLAVSDATHGHIADNLTLDTSNTTFLTVQDAAHSHGTDAVGLTLDTWLAIVDAAHAHAADAPTLSASVALLIAEALHAHYADALVLSFPGETTLTPADVAAIAAAVLAALNATTIPVNMVKTNGQTITGDGTESDKFRSHLVG